MATRSTLQRGAVLAAAAALAAGLCAPAQAKITLTFANWAAAEAATRPGIEEMIRKFEAANPDIEIKSEAVSFSEIARQLVLRIRSGNPPDVAEIAGNDLFLVAASGKLEPLDSYLGADGLKQFKPDSIRVLREGGKLIALPWTDSPAGFWYNKEIMQKAGLDPSKPPRTIDELMAAMKAIKSSQPDVIPLGLDTTNRAFSMISNWPWLQTFGATPFGPAGASATSPAMKQYLTWMRELAKNGYIDPGRKIGEFRPLAAQNKVAFHWDQVLLQGVIQSVNKMSDADFYKTWSVTTMPAGPSGKPFAFDGGHQLIMFSDSKNKQAAWKFMQFLATAPEAVRDFTIKAESSLPPVTALAPELVRQLDTPVFNAFVKEIAPTLTMPPYGNTFAAASTAVMAGVQEAVTGQQPIDQVADGIAQRLSRP